MNTLNKIMNTMTNPNKINENYKKIRDVLDKTKYPIIVGIDNNFRKMTNYLKSSRTINPIFNQYNSFTRKVRLIKYSTIAGITGLIGYKFYTHNKPTIIIIEREKK